MTYLLVLGALAKDGRRSKTTAGERSTRSFLLKRAFKSLWPHMLTMFTSEYLYVLRLVAIMLLIPLDTSEAERIFSLMNDIKTSERSTLGRRNLAALMYYGTLKGLAPDA